jgi:hypothetical protein
METENADGSTDDTTVVYPRALITCQTEASQLSSADSSNPKKVFNYVLLRHNLRCSPAYGAAILNYSFVVRAIGKSGAPGDPISALRDNGDAFDAVFATSTAPGAVLLSSSPSETATLESRSETTSHSFGVNVGFFGSEATGGLNYSYSFSDTHSWNIPSVSCSDASTHDRVYKKFNMNSNAQQIAPFEISFSEIFQLPAENYSGHNMRFEIGLCVSLKDRTYEKNGRVDKIVRYANVVSRE